MDLDYVIVKISTEWLVGSVSNFKFTAARKIKKLSDMKGVTSYITLSKFLKENKIQLTEKEILEKMGTDRVYVASALGYSTKRKFEENWWNTRNSYCLECSNSCKQSHKINVVICPDFRSNDRSDIPRENNNESN